MNKNNQRIHDFLSKYVNLPDPNYAVLLTGVWGCGKTYFVEKWKDVLSTSISEDKESTVLKPVYVSLFGLSSIAEINQAVTREIYPFMKSKLYNLGKATINAVSSVAFNCDISKITKDRLKGEVNLELDIVSLFKSDRTIGENRIIIFDDFERCKAPVVDLLGYINTFVEHSNIRVILICNEAVFEEEDRKDDKKLYESFKEKVVGRVFKVEPDVEAAIDYFCANSLFIQLTDEQKNIAADAFRKTGYDNLRLLYQSLQDFGLLCEKLKYDNNVVRQKRIIDGLLIQYIVAYNEYAKSDKVKEMAQCEPSMFNLLNFSVFAGTDDRDEAAAIIRKYQTIDTLTPQGSMFGNPMPWILNSIKTGADISDYISTLLNQKECEETLAQRISKYWQMEQPEFDQTYNDAIEYLRNPDSDIVQIIQIANTLIALDEKQIKAFDEKVLDNAKENIRIILKNYSDVNVLKRYIDYFQNGTKAEMKFLDIPDRVKQFVDDVEMLIKERYNELEGNEIKEFEKVNDTNFEIVTQEFFQQFGTNAVCKYAVVPFFHRVDPVVFASSVIALSNKHKIELGNLILNRYEISINNTSLKNVFGVELDNLATIRDSLRTSATHKDGVDKYNIERFADYVDKSISNINQ